MQWAAKIAAEQAEIDNYNAHTARLLDALDRTVEAFAELDHEDIVNQNLTSLESTGSDIV